MSIDSRKSLSALSHKDDSISSEWGLQLPSLSRSQSLLTKTTTSSYSTVWGPGAHSGRALKAFGDAVKNAILVVAVNTWLSTQKTLIRNRTKLDALDDSEYYNLCIEIADLTRSHWGMSIRLSALRLARKLLIAPKSSTTSLRTLHTFVAYGFFKDLYLGVPNDTVLELRDTIMSVISTALPQREACQLFVLHLQSWLKHPRRKIPPPLSIPDLPTLDKASLSRALIEAGIGPMLAKALNPTDGAVWWDILQRSPLRTLNDTSLSTISRPSTEMAPPSRYITALGGPLETRRIFAAAGGGFMLGELVEEPEAMTLEQESREQPPTVNLRLSSFDMGLDVPTSIDGSTLRDDSIALSEASTLSPDEWLLEQEKVIRDPTQLDAMEPTEFLSFCESLVELTKWTGRTRLEALGLVQYLLENPKSGLDPYQLLVLFVMNGLFLNLQTKQEAEEESDNLKTKDASDKTVENLNSLISNIIAERMDLDLDAKKLYVQHLQVMFGTDLEIPATVPLQNARRGRIRWAKSQDDTQS